MRELPILFSAPMVRAILEGRKTVTRRIVKLPSESSLGLWEPTVVGGGSSTDRNGNACQEMTAIWHTRSGRTIAAPWQPGNWLWVRETFMRVPHPSEFGFTREMLPHTWDACCEVAGTFLYRADPCSDLVADGRPWSPSIHMPRAASRITLEVTGVRVERLHDGEGEGDRESRYIAEGINRIHHGDGAYYYSAIRNVPHPQNWTDPFDAWRELWLATGGDWDANPWVWVVEFKPIEVVA